VDIEDKITGLKLIKSLRRKTIDAQVENIASRYFCAFKRIILFYIFLVQFLFVGDKVRAVLELRGKNLLSRLKGLVK
jgi:hypothetical protein